MLLAVAKVGHFFLNISNQQIRIALTRFSMYGSIRLPVPARFFARFSGFRMLSGVGRLAGQGQRTSFGNCDTHGAIHEFRDGQQIPTQAKIAKAALQEGLQGYTAQFKDPRREIEDSQQFPAAFIPQASTSS